MKIKICGMRDKDNVSSIARFMPDFMGFIFYPGSPRDATILLDKKTIEALNQNIVPVAVFVNEDLKKVQEVIRKFGITHVQLHGNESVEYCQNLKSKGITIFKVFSIENTADFTKTKEYETVSDYFLFDTKSPKHGGTGIKFDWNLLQEYKGSRPVILSGGIKPDDAMLIKKVMADYPFVTGIDLNSKFEISPGMKDAQKLSTFLGDLKTISALQYGRQ